MSYTGIQSFDPACNEVRRQIDLRLEAAFGLLSIVKAVLGAFIRMAPDKVALSRHLSVKRLGKYLI